MTPEPLITTNADATTTAVASAPSSSETMIQDAPAAGSVAADLLRHERMIDARTLEQPVVLGVALAGLGAAKNEANVMLLPRESNYDAHVLALAPLRPLAIPTASAGVFGGTWEGAQRLAILAVEPLLAPTPAAVHGHALIPSTRPPFVFTNPRRTSLRTSSRSRAYRAFAELADWLGMTQQETAQLLGIGRTTPLAWARGHEPRPRSVRRLYQTHALVKTLVRRLGVEDARRWLYRGAPSPLELIKAGDIAAADDRADELIFGASIDRPRLDTWAEENDRALPAARPERAPRRLTRPAPRRRMR